MQTTAVDERAYPQGERALRIASVGHAVFAVVLVGIGILCLVRSDFVGGWGGVPRDLPVQAWLPWINAMICLACGLGLFWWRTAAIAARVPLICFLLWFVLFKLSHIVLTPGVEQNHQSAGGTAVIVAGAWVLYAGFAIDRDQRWLGFAAGERGLCIARVFGHVIHAGCALQINHNREAP